MEVVQPVSMTKTAQNDEDEVLEDAVVAPPGSSSKILGLRLPWAPLLALPRLATKGRAAASMVMMLAAMAPFFLAFSSGSADPCPASSARPCPRRGPAETSVQAAPAGTAAVLPWPPAAAVPSRCPWRPVLEMLPPPWLMVPAVGWEARPAAVDLSSRLCSAVAAAAPEHASSVAEAGSKVPEAKVVPVVAEEAVVEEVVVVVVLVLVVAVVVEVLAVQVEEEAVAGLMVALRLAMGPPGLEEVRAGFAEILLLLGQVLQGSV